MNRKSLLPLAAIGALALAIVPAADGRGAAASASGLKIISVTVSPSARVVTVKLGWVKALIAKAGNSDRLAVALTSLPAKGLPVTIKRQAATNGPTLRIALTAAQARSLRAARGVIATATQGYDSPTDSDTNFELNGVAITKVRGVVPAAGRACAATLAAGSNASGCDLRGADLRNADLNHVNLSRSDLSGARLDGARMQTAEMGGAKLVGASLAGVVWSATEQSALTLPDSGSNIVDAIAKAKTRIDVISYTFGGPDIVGQASKPGALMKAVSSGVDVNIVLNGGYKHCASMSSADQITCAQQSEFDSTYAIQQSLAYAHAHPIPGVQTAGNFTIHFASQNYQITHQKSILIDMIDKGGVPSIGPDSVALVSTGNLGTYGWAARSKHPDYLVNPSAGCTSAATACADDWAARDFTITLTDPQLLGRIAQVFMSDYNCETWGASAVYKNLSGTTMADTWANGTLLGDGSSYPSIGTSAFYGNDAPNPLLQPAPQGNSRDRTLKLIASASKTLIVYNEEMADPDVINALAAAAKRKVDVQVVMASEICNKYSTVSCTLGQPVPSLTFDYLTSNGVKITLLNAHSGLYIHAKAIVADATDGFMGSENFGLSSMNYNRELGLMLTNRTDTTKVKSGIPSIESVDGIAQIFSAFTIDSSPAGGGIAYNQASVYAKPVAPSTWPTPYPALATDFPMQCGPIPARGIPATPN